MDAENLNLWNSSDFAKLSEFRKESVINFDNLSEQQKQIAKRLPQTPNIFQFFYHQSKSLNQPLIYLLIGGFGLLFCLAFGKNITQVFYSNAFLFILAAIFSVPFVHGAYLAFRSFSSPFPAKIMITPLYIFQMDGKEIKCWGIWSFVDFLLTEVYVNGIYSTTKIIMLVPDGELEFNIKDENNINSFMQTVKQWKAVCDNAKERKRWDYFESQDILKEFKSFNFQPTVSSQNEANNRKFAMSSIIRYFIYSIISLLIGWILVRLSLA